MEDREADIAQEALVTDRLVMVVWVILAEAMVDIEATQLLVIVGTGAEYGRIPITAIPIITTKT